MSRTIRVIKVEPQKPAYVKEIDNGLKSLQKEVEGLIQVIYPFEDPDVVIICNEEAKIRRMPFNRGLWAPGSNKLYDVICGNFLIVGASAKSEHFLSIPKSKVDRYLKKYSKPQYLVSINNQLTVIEDNRK